MCRYPGKAALQSPGEWVLLRIQLCGRLDLDGLTPDEDFIQQALQELAIPIHVMIRPRGGDFVYSVGELAQMEQEIAYCKTQGVPGIVLGGLTPSGELDLENILKLAALAKPETHYGGVEFSYRLNTQTQLLLFEQLLAHRRQN